MDAETRSQIEDLTTLRDALRARLRVLELQRAGYSANPETETEIEDIEVKIRQIDQTAPHARPACNTWPGVACWRAFNRRAL